MTQTELEPIDIGEACKDIVGYIQRTIKDMEDTGKHYDRIALIGIGEYGLRLARCVSNLYLQENEDSLPVGKVQLSNDNGRVIEDPNGGTGLPDVIDGTVVFLLDYAVNTGNSAMAALNAVESYGRPNAIRLAAIYDNIARRTFPISPDFVHTKDYSNQGRAELQGGRLVLEDKV